MLQRAVRLSQTANTSPAPPGGRALLPLRAVILVETLAPEFLRGGYLMQSDSGHGAALTPGIVFENLQAFQRTFALKAAIELDIFRAVGQELGDVPSIARHAKASERGVRILCDFLVINGLL